MSALEAEYRNPRKLGGASQAFTTQGAALAVCRWLETIADMFGEHFTVPELVTLLVANTNDEVVRAHGLPPAGYLHHAYREVEARAELAATLDPAIEEGLAEDFAEADAAAHRVDDLAAGPAAWESGPAEAAEVEAEDADAINRVAETATAADAAADPLESGQIGNRWTPTAF